MNKGKTLREKLLDLEKLGENPGQNVAQQRGTDFEEIILDLFENNNLLIKRSYHTSDNNSQQIDGAIEVNSRVFLIESKWTSSNIAASELFGFLGKVESKFSGTFGIFISKNELTSNFINSLRAGRRQSVLVIHGDDVATIFQKNFPLTEYINETIRGISTDNITHLSANEFLKIRDTKKKKDVTHDKDEIKLLLKDLKNNIQQSLITALLENKDESKIINELNKLLEIYPTLIIRKGSDSTLVKNISVYISHGAKLLPQKTTDADKRIFGERLESKLNSVDYHEIISSFSDRLKLLSESLQDDSSKALVKVWDETRGEFEKENLLVEPTKSLWPHILDESKVSLIKKFIRIICDSFHQRGFPQYRLALEILNDKQNKPLLIRALNELIKYEYQKLLDSEEYSESIETKEWAWKWTERSFRDLLNEIPNLKNLFEAEKKVLLEEDG